MKAQAYALVVLFILAGVSIGSAEAKTVDVGKNYTYQTIAEGVAVASAGDVVFIHEGIYVISTSIVPKSSVTLRGTGNQTIIHTAEFSDISSTSNPAMIFIHDVAGVTVDNITFQGPAVSRSHQHSNGGTSLIGGLREARNGIKIESASDIKVTNCTFTLLLSDGIRCAKGAEDVNISKCKFICAGHDSVSCYKGKNIKIDNCWFDLMINCNVRLYNIQGCSISHSTFVQSTPGTGAGYIEFEGTVNKVAIHHNIFLKSTDPVLWSAGGAGKSISVNDNILYEVQALRSSYGTYDVTMLDNEVYTEKQNWTVLGYGYNYEESAAQKKQIVINEDEAEAEEETDEEFCIDNCNGTSIPTDIIEEDCEKSQEGNCTATADNTSDEGAVSDVLTQYFDTLVAQYFDFSSESVQSAAIIANESSSDMEQAKVLLNNTSAEEQQLGRMYLQASELKLQYAKDMLNISQSSFNQAKDRMSITECNSDC